MSDFNTDFIVSFLFTIYFIMMGFLYVYSVIKTSNKHKRKNKLFSFGLKIPRCIEKTYWQIFINSNYRCNHYKYHDDDEVIAVAEAVKSRILIDAPRHGDLFFGDRFLHTVPNYLSF